MERNTITTLGQLQTGDRFCFIKKDEVWQVTGSFGNHVTFNKFTSEGAPIFKYDEQKSKNISVRFLRHTIKEVAQWK